MIWRHEIICLCDRVSMLASWSPNKTRTFSEPNQMDSFEVIATIVLS